MAVTLQEILRPLFFMCFIMGLDFFPRKQSKIRWITHLNILYSLTIRLAHAYLFFFILMNFKREILFNSISTEISQELNFFIYTIFLIISFYYQKKFEIIINKLAAIDDTLEKLGIPKMYEKLHIKSKQVIIGWIIYSLSMNIIDSMTWSNFEEIASWGFCNALILNHCIHINALVDMLFTFVLWYIGTRFDKVNEHVRCLLVRESHELRYTESRKESVIILRRNTNTDYKQILWISMHLHSELSRLSRELNLIFTVQITFEMVPHFLYVISLFYYLYWLLLIQQQREKIYTIYYWLSIGLWIFVLLVRLYIVNYICENVSVKAKKIGELFHQLSHIYQYADVWKEIYHFTLQLMHHPLKFTGMGLFYFGYEFLRKFFMGSLMYVIIMVQFKVSHNY